MENNLNLRTLIPVLAGSAILSIGCSAERNTARKYCKKWEECAPSSFNDEYDNIAQCTKAWKLYQKAQNYELKVQESPECARANRAAADCAVDELTCDYWDDEEAWNDDRPTFCLAEQQEVLDLCYDEGDYVYDYY